MKRGQGSFGSRAGAKWSRAGADARRRSESAKPRTSAGTSFPVAPPSAAAIREFISAGSCPWCGSGPYDNLAMHTNRGHGITARELRELAGLTSRGRLCSPALSAKARENLERREDREEISARGTERAVEVHAHRIASRAQRTRWAESVVSRDALIVERLRAGDFAAMIAADLGINPVTVARAARRLGLSTDLRQIAARHPRRVAEFRANASAGVANKAEALKVCRVARFGELGGSWEAVHAVAAEWGVSAKTATAYLREAGVELPDGRVATTHRRPRNRRPPCAREDCDRPSVAHRLCDSHYRATRRSARQSA